MIEVLEKHRVLVVEQIYVPKRMFLRGGRFIQSQEDSAIQQGVELLENLVALFRAPEPPYETPTIIRPANQ